MKKHLQVKNSYKIWSASKMRTSIRFGCKKEGFEPKKYFPYIIEWWAHNIGYYLTLPFVKNAKIKALNERFKHVDLMIKGEEL